MSCMNTLDVHSESCDMLPVEARGIKGRNPRLPQTSCSHTKPPSQMPFLSMFLSMPDYVGNGAHQS